MTTQNLDRPFKNLTIEELELKLEKCSSASTQKGRLIDEIQLRKSCTCSRCMYGLKCMSH